MRRVIPRLLVACFTFALGLSLAALSLELRRAPSPDVERTMGPRSQYCDPSLSLAPGADSSAIANLPLIPYCALETNPDCYDGKIVRVAARIFWIENNMFFATGGCYKLAQPTHVEVHLAKAEEVYRVMVQPCGPQCYESLDVVVVGRFEKSTRSLGAMPAWSLPSFEVMSFESAARVRR
ncbi:MAG TPA: hypothetical protein VF544_09435 [Pyrinomonadaceae bacterium]|jgi:hypothetical protein